MEPKNTNEGELVLSDAQFAKLKKIVKFSALMRIMFLAGILLSAVLMAVDAWVFTSTSSDAVFKILKLIVAAFSLVCALVLFFNIQKLKKFAKECAIEENEKGFEG